MIEVSDPDPGDPYNTDLTLTPVYSTTIGYFGTGVAAWKDGANTYAVATEFTSGLLHNTQLHVFDVTNPVSVSPLVIFDTNKRISSRITMRGSLAYIPGQADASVVDLSTPALPLMRGAFGQPYLTRFAVLDDGTTLFATSSDPSWPLWAFDLSDPAYPTELGRFGPADGFTALGGDLAVSADTLYCLTDDGVVTVDVSDHAQPTPLGSTGAVGTAEYVNFGLAVDGNYAYAYSPVEGLAVVDISNPVSPAPLAHLEGLTATSLGVAGNLMVAAGGSTFSVIDASLPETPILRSTTASTASAAAVIGPYAFVAPGGGIQSWDLTDPDNPQMRGSAPGSGGGYPPDPHIAVYDAPNGIHDHVYLTYAYRVEVYDVDSPDSPIAEAPIGVDSYRAADVAVADDRLYTIGYSSFHIWSLVDPGHPVLQSTLSMGGSPAGVAAQGNYAYVVFDTTLNVIDVTTPSAPFVAGTMHLLHEARDVVVNGTRVFIAMGTAGIAEVDVSVPTAPRLDGWINPVGSGAGSVTGLVVANDEVFAGDGSNGVWSLPGECEAQALQVVACTPTDAGNTGTLQLTIAGFGFASGCTVTLEGPDSPIIATVASLTPYVLQAIADVAGATPGSWSVRVTNPSSATAALPSALNLTSGGGPDLWTTPLIPSTLRYGIPNTCDVIFGNDGNVDAVGYVIFLTGLPLDWVVDTGTPLYTVHRTPEMPPSWPDTISGPTVFSLPDQHIVTIIVPRIRIGRTFLLRVFLTPPSNGPPVTLHVGAVSPQSYAFDFSTLAGPTTTQIETTFLGAPPCPGLSDLALSCLNAAGANVPGALPCLVGFGGGLVEASETIKDWTDQCPTEPPNEALPCQLENGAIGRIRDFLDGAYNDAISTWEYAAWMFKAFNCLLGYVDADKAKDVVECLVNIEATKPECWVLASDVVTQPFGSVDPNAKLGPPGAGVAHYITALDDIHYAITFENLPSAGLPARDVAVRDTLPAALDPGSVRFLGAVLGDVPVGFPVGTGNVVERLVDLRPDEDVVVRLHADVDLGTRVVEATLSCLDPATGLPPADPLVGWLPPNVSPPEGDGLVVFRARPSAGVQDGDILCNRSAVVFDTNPSILTNAWCNTFDVIAPTSSVDPLAPVQTDAIVTLHVSGSDVGSGIREYAIYVSDDGGPVSEWAVNRSDTAEFRGRGGHTYDFYSSARDSAGNVEALPQTPDATTEVPFDALGTPKPKIELALNAVIPLPSGGGFAVDVAWPGTGRGRVALFDVAGRRRWQEVLDDLSPGRYRFQATPGLASGIYWVRLIGNERRSVVKAVLIR